MDTYTELKSTSDFNVPVQKKVKYQKMIVSKSKFYFLTLLPSLMMGVFLVLMIYLLKLNSKLNRDIKSLSSQNQSLTLQLQEAKNNYKEFENKVNVLEDEKMMIQSELDKKIDKAHEKKIFIFVTYSFSSL